jgi:hypothetical protein
MAERMKAGMWCTVCDAPVAGVKQTHRTRNTTAGLLAFGTGGLSLLGAKVEGYICPRCGQKSLRPATQADFARVSAASTSNLDGQVTQFEAATEAERAQEPQRARPGPTAETVTERVEALCDAGLGSDQTFRVVLLLTGAVTPVTFNFKPPSPQAARGAGIRADLKVFIDTGEFEDAFAKVGGGWARLVREGRLRFEGEAPFHRAFAKAAIACSTSEDGADPTRRDDAANAPASPASAAESLTRVEQLERLAALRDSGALTEAEFSAEKERILRG